MKLITLRKGIFLCGVNEAVYLRLPEIKMPKIKLPDFSLNGQFSLVPPSVPKLSVSWYAKGGIFISPSVIGVGQASTEQVLPIDRLDYLLAKALKKANGLSNENSNSGIYASYWKLHK